MVIKSLVIKGFKGFYDEYSIDFDKEQTIIEGENFQGKTTIGEAICWCFLGCNLFGNEKTANLINKNSDTAYCKLTFLDNDNIEHVIYRSKGKENSVILDNHKADIEMLSKFYYSKKIFLSVYNPYYFNSLEPREQRDLLRGILPPINYTEAFELLDQSEKDILVQPRMDLNQFMTNARSDIKELEKEENNFLGRIQYANSVINTSLEKEKVFSNEEYLKSLEKEYNTILKDNNIESKAELQMKIKSSESKILSIENEIQDLEKQGQEIKQILDRIEKENEICPYCSSKIDKLKTQKIKVLSISGLNKLLAKRSNKLEELKELKVQKSILTIKCDFSNNDKEEKLEKLNKKITELRLEKDDIQRYNYEIQAKIKAVEKAKDDLEVLNKALEENRNTKNMLKMQIEVAKSLNMKIIESQMNMVKDCLDKVKLAFYKVDSDTGEIKDDYKILYDGKEYNVLSLSEKIRASLEISNLINKKVGLNGPTFIDNSESITHYNSQFENQVIFAKVVPKQKLRLVS